MHTKAKTKTEPPQTTGGTNKYQQQQNHHFRTDSSLIYQGDGLNAFYWRQIFALNSVVVKT